MEQTELLEWQSSPYVCRCCSSSGCYKDLTSEYFWLGNREVYSEMLLEVFNIKLSNLADSSRDRLICEVCITRLRAAANFKNQVLESEDKFLEHINNVKHQNELSEVKIEGLKEELIFEFKENNDGDFSSMDDESLATLKTEPDEKRPKKSLKRKKVKRKKIVIDEEPCSSKKKAKGNHRGSVRVYDPMREMLNRDASRLIENSNMLAFRWRNNKFMCYCCKEMYLDMATLRSHSETTHKKEKIIEQVHNRYYPALPKVDVTSLKCSICEMQINGLGDLKNHLLLHDVHFESDKDPLLPFSLGEGKFSCQVCMEEFRVFKTLNNHMNKHYGTHICCNCGAGFQHEFALKSHESRHSSKEYKCDKCQTVFPNSYKKMQHYYTVHKKGGRYGCPHCEAKFMDYDKRLAHLVKAHNMVKPSVKCEYCEKSFANNKLLKQHIRCLHMNERKHTCTVCKYKFFSSSELKKHSESHNTDLMELLVTNKCS